MKYTYHCVNLPIYEKYILILLDAIMTTTEQNMDHTGSDIPNYPGGINDDAPYFDEGATDMDEAMPLDDAENPQEILSDCLKKFA